MPTGAAFFTGNASSALATKVNNSSLVIPTKTEHSAGRIARPNEIIDEVITVKSSLTAEKKSNLNRSNQSDAGSNEGDSLTPYVPMQVEESDSDASVHEDGEEHTTLGLEGLEMWPPKKYDATAPLSLPFGPKTATMRKLLAAQVSNPCPLWWHAQHSEYWPFCSFYDLAYFSQSIRCRSPGNRRAAIVVSRPVAIWFEFRTIEKQWRGRSVQWRTRICKLSHGCKNSQTVTKWKAGQVEVI